MARNMVPSSRQIGMSRIASEALPRTHKVLKVHAARRIVPVEAGERSLAAHARMPSIIVPSTQAAPAEGT